MSIRVGCNLLLIRESHLRLVVTWQGITDELTNG